MAEIAVRGPRVAVDAAMLTATVGIDRLLEGDVRAVVAGDDCARGLFVHLRAQSFEISEAFPAVVERPAQRRLEPAGVVGARPAPAAALGVHETFGRCLRFGLDAFVQRSSESSSTKADDEVYRASENK